MSISDEFLTQMRNIGIECVGQVEGSHETVFLLQGVGNKVKASAALPRGIVSTRVEQAALRYAIASVKEQFSRRSGQWPEAPQTE